MVVLLLLVATAVLSQDVVYRDGGQCFPMDYGQCYTCNALGMSLMCTEDVNDDDDVPRCYRSTSACMEDDDNGDYTNVARVPCGSMPQCGIAYAAAEVEGFAVSAELPLHVQRLSSSKAGVLALDRYEANFLGVLSTLAFGTDEGSVFVKRVLSNGTVVTNAGTCADDAWCQAPGGLTYSKYTTFYNSSYSDVFDMHGARLSPFSSRLLPGRAASGSGTDEMLLDIESTPVKIAVEDLRHLWLQNNYIGTHADELDGISLQLTRLVNVADMSYDPYQEELSLTLTVDGEERAATNHKCRLLGKYEENTVSRCDFSFEVSFSAGFSYLDSSYFSYLFSSSFSHSWSRTWGGDYDEANDHWEAKPAFTLFD